MKKHGFTLIEMMVTIVVSAILLGIAVPGFQSLINKNRLGTQASDLVADFALARSEAVKRGIQVSVCTSTNGTSCTTSSWGAGRIVFTDTGVAGSVDGTDEVLRVSGAMEGGLTLTGTEPIASHVQYTPTGRVTSSGSLTLCKAGFKERVIAIANTGRVGSQESKSTCT